MTVAETLQVLKAEDTFRSATDGTGMGDAVADGPEKGAVSAIETFLNSRMALREFSQDISTHPSRYEHFKCRANTAQEVCDVRSRAVQRGGPSCGRLQGA